MKIINKGELKDNWYWMCPKCRTIGYHETDDGYNILQYTDRYRIKAFKCPTCGEPIWNNKYCNRLLAWIIAKIKNRQNP